MTSGDSMLRKREATRLEGDVGDESSSSSDWMSFSTLSVRLKCSCRLFHLRSDERCWPSA